MKCGFFKLKATKRLPSTKLDNVTILPDVVFFDYDGTICNNSKYLVKAFNYALKLNFDKKKDKSILREIKKIKKDSDKWAYIKQNCATDIFVKCNEDYDKYISNQRLCFVRNVKKIIKLFYKNNIPMFVISQKRGDGLRDELKKAKLDVFFKKAYGTLDFGELQKPSFEYIKAVQNDSKTSSKRSWMIGDRCSDVVAGMHMDSKIFIIDKNEVEKINENHYNDIGDKIFFTSYLRLFFHTKKLFKKELLKYKKKENKEN